MVASDRAIVKQSGSTARFVFVYKNGKVAYKQVEVGQRIDKVYEILSGLSAGEQIVISGQSRLIDGSEVEVVK